MSLVNKVLFEVRECLRTYHILFKYYEMPELIPRIISLDKRGGLSKQVAFSVPFFESGANTFIHSTCAC